MKKIIFLSITLLIGIASSAQTKGEKYISGHLSASCGTQTTTLSKGAYSTSTTQPSDATFEIGAEIGYFVSDKIRVSMSIISPFTSSPSDKDGDKWLKDKTFGLELSPSAAYYIKLADRFYYTPEIAGSYGFGSYKNEISSSELYNLKYNGWSVSLYYAAFEFRVNDKFAVGAAVGGLNYASLSISDKDTNQSVKNNQFSFKFNSADISLKLYF